MALLTLEKGTFLYTEAETMAYLSAGRDNSYGVYQLSENGKWFQKYKIGFSRGFPGCEGYSLWTYEDDGSCSETFLWANDDYYTTQDENAENALTPPGTEFEEAISLAFELMGIPNADHSPSVTFDVAADYANDPSYSIIMTFTPTDYTQLKKKIDQYA